MTLFGFIELFRRIANKLKKFDSPIVITQSRFEPNPRNPNWGRRPLSFIERIVIHQELGWGTAKQVHAYHISENSHLKPGVGAPGISYHYVVGANGELIQVNDERDIVWHCRGQNMNSIGIMVVGDFAGVDHVGDEPSLQQIRALNKLVDHLVDKYKLEITDVYGHDEFGKPACPGFAISSFIKNYNKGQFKRI